MSTQELTPSASSGQSGGDERFIAFRFDAEPEGNTFALYALSPQDGGKLDLEASAAQTDRETAERLAANAGVFHSVARVDEHGVPRYGNGQSLPESLAFERYREWACRKRPAWL